MKGESSYSDLPGTDYRRYVVMKYIIQNGEECVELGFRPSSPNGNPVLHRIMEVKYLKSGLESWGELKVKVEENIGAIERLLGEAESMKKKTLDVKGE